MYNISPSPSNINFNIGEKSVLLGDDVAIGDGAKSMLLGNGLILLQRMFR